MVLGDNIVLFIELLFDVDVIHELIPLNSLVWITKLLSKYLSIMYLLDSIVSRNVDVINFFKDK